MEESFAVRLHRHADRDPERTALTFEPLDAGDPAVRLSYGDLVGRSAAVAAALAGRVRTGDRVVLLMPTGPEFAAAFLGCLAAGVIAVPLPLPLDEASRRRVAGVLRDCAPALIVSTSLVQQLAQAAPDEPRGLPAAGSWLLADELPASAPAGPVPVRDNDIAFLQYTSGSTSAPRGVLVSHAALMHNEGAIGDAFGVHPGSAVVSWLPLHHDMGLIGGLLQPLHAGARGVILDPSTFLRRPASWLEVVAREQADISGGPNFAYEMCVRKVTDAESAGLDLSRWRVAFNGAGQVHPRTLRAFSERFAPAGFRPAAHTPCYGLAEATLLVTAAAPGAGASSGVFTRASLEAGRPEPAPAGAATLELAGYPLPRHTSVTVADVRTAAPLTDGRTGEIVVTGPSNGSGYWGGPRSGPGTPVHTGDLGFVHDGELFIQGRSKDLIVHRGRNIYPEDLEADVSACHPGVRPGCGAVFAVDQDGDEAVVVCQEIRPGTTEASWPEIAGRIRETVVLVHGVAVRTVLLVAPRAVTKTSSGKIQRSAARARYLAGELPVLLDSTVATGPETGAAGLTGPFDSAGELADALCEHLQATLGLPERPAPGDGLASLGLDSLAATQLQYELERALGVALPLSVALRASSIASLAATALAAPAPVAVGEAEGYELTQAQRALWFLHRVDPDSTAYNVTRAVRVVGDLDADALDAALTRLVERHPSLQLSIHAEAGEPRAELHPWPVRSDRIDARSWDEARLADWYRVFAATPFDLAGDHLVRVAVVRRAGDSVVVLSLHHIACDIASLTVLLAELARAYAGEPLDPVAPATISPARHEKAVLAARAEELAAYWKTALEGELPVLALPKVAAAGGPASGALQFDAPPGVTAALLAFARRSGLTLHNVLLSAYEILLHRLSGQSDLLVGIPAAGRTDPRLAAYIGYLVNVLPVRSGGPDGRSFAEHARATQERVLDALDHQDLPLARITRLINPDREAAGSTIFQAMFSFYGTALPGGAAAAGVIAGDPAATVPLGRAATMHGFPLPDVTAQSDLGLNAVVRAGVLSFELQYDPRRVEHAQAEELAGALRTLLAAVTEDPETPAVRLPLLSVAGTEAAVAAGFGPAIARTGHYVDDVERQAARRPDALAADDGERTLTYAELDERANHVAARLRALGAGVDRNVVVSARRSVDYLVVLLGIHKADACYVPVSPIEAPRRAAAMIAATSPVAVIADDAGQWLLDEPREGSVPIRLGELVAGRRAEPVPRLAPDHAACTIIHTSGSTGLPKAAVSTNYGVTNHMWQMVEHFDLGADDGVAQTGPVSFDISVWQLLTPLIVGGLVRIVPEPASQSPAKLLAVVAAGAVTMLELVPSAIVALLDAGLAATPGRLKVMLSTGEALTPEVLRRWVAELPSVPVHNAYGPAECTDDVTAGICADGPDGPLTPSIGWPLANTTVHVLDDELAPVPPGVTGLLHVGWGAVGRGYRGDPRRTAEKFVPDPYSPVPGGRMYRTGDLGRRAPDGALDFLGRADSQTKVRGLRIEAGEVEGALRQCPGVTAAALRVHPGANGAVLAGYVVLGEPAGEDGEGRLLSPAEDERLRTALAEHLPRFMIPTLLVALPRLPRSKNGKVDYKALRYAGPDRRGAEDPGLADDPLATAVRGIWSALLGTEAGWADSFFALGGHSLLALAMVDRVGELLDLEVPVDAVFAAPRLDQFVARVRRADGRGIRAATAGHGYPAPAGAAQERFWFLRERDPDQPTYNMPGVLRIRGELNEDAFEDALRTVLARHPVLLARFTDDQDGLRWSPGRVEDFELPRLDLRGAVAEFGPEAFTSLAETEAAVVADLRRELPFRAMLARLGADEWSLLVVVDHIVCDGWSLSVFLGDLAAAYNGAGPAAPPTYTFADYCHDELAGRHGLDRDAVLAEWRGVADGTLALSPLAATPTGRTGTGQVVQWIEADLAAAIRALAARTGSTPYMVFATALAALTHSGANRRETALLGTLIAQRDRPEWRRLIGPLLTVGVLAVDLAPDDPVATALRGTRDAALRAYRSAHLPFQELAPLFPAAPGGDGSPFEVLLVLQPPETPVVFDGLATELEDLVPDVAAYPLVVDIEQRGERYRVSWRYAADRYEHAAVADLAVLLDAAVRATTADPDQPLQRLRTAAGGGALHAEQN